MLVKEIPVQSLGNHSYLLVSQETHQAAVIDPARDVDRYINEANLLGVTISYTLDTHLHNDFLSGSRELATRVGAEVVAPAPTGLLFPHLPVNEGDTLNIGELEITVLFTPGHTPEHCSYPVTDPSHSKEPVAIFTGGALMVGGAARVDLLGERLAPYLARWQYRTLYNVFLALPDELEVYPTHGGGSFCSSAPVLPGQSSSTTIGQERKNNVLLSIDGEDEFIDLVLSDLPSYPLYYKRMASINRKGPPILGKLPTLQPLSACELRKRLDSDTLLVDLRPAESFGAAHIPGTYAVPYGDSVGTWVGWTVPWDSNLALLGSDRLHYEDTVRQLIRIGYDNLVGYLEGGIEAWEQAGFLTAAVPSITVEELKPLLSGSDAPMLLDVRQRAEWEAGRIPGTVNIELGELQEHLDGLPRDVPLISICLSGFRSTTAASILLRNGINNITLLSGGTEAWRKKGFPLSDGLR